MDYYLLLCGSLLCAGLMLNIFDRRMFCLTAVVGVGFFMPAPDQSAGVFYGFCIAMETFVGILAMQIDRKAGFWIADIAVLLVCSHCMGWYLDGSPPFSPYRLIVKILEFSQIAACVALSPVIAPILRNRDEASI